MYNCGNASFSSQGEIDVKRRELLDFSKSNEDGDKEKRKKLKSYEVETDTGIHSLEQ